MSFDNGSQPTSIRLSSDDQKVFVGDAEGYVSIKELISVSVDRGIKLFDLEKHAPVFSIKKAHRDAINKINLLSENLIATGDDSGIIKIWDLRSKKKVMRYEEHSDFISDLVYVKHKKHLISAGKPDVLARSDNMEDELLSLAVMHNNKKVVCGTQEGVLQIYSYGYWGDMSDRFPHHPPSIQCLKAVDHSRALTGAADGVIRLIEVLPNRIIKAIGIHGDDPIEGMAVSSDASFVATISHDSFVKFHDIDLQEQNEPLLKKGKYDRHRVEMTSFFSDLVENNESDKDNEGNEVDSNADSDDSFDED
ncbi:WD40 repeat-like protein [Rozella allomycis CSF55]|uniref:WD repeat-containing protein JIP5 n=1 Tax=Rozella allomycis (strain CSF55) TaxID=988480 RepID=A0A4P9YLH0_ROZAC|nr:WD40 repeat-like protein [Rozella allomycis CSF55]